ncbi:hypothetical protein [Thalassoroseus pseudoceratinae]|uniref:hypothetical protein n=1 Tax=Thalassoroseus pseudoceratinae TaxID=2713176 RepID=UPI00141F07A3|nr:hypothetical protein [Thalassoroseus pseudoceratinae]
MIDEAMAIQIANDRLKKVRGTTKHMFAGCDFREERTGRYSSPASWIVTYLKPPPSGMTVDDGGQLIAISIDAETGNAKVFRGL